ncbi:MAG: exodeoxyribonuclease VII small subunit [Eubacteriales bacterium]|nr:exodeoxyribonuclease VII small subunit [Eubacteriales bacterium]
MIKEELIKNLEDEKIKELSIEDSLSILEELLREIDSEETSLEDSFKLYENGLKLVNHAKNGIDLVEKKLRILNGEE